LSLLPAGNLNFVVSCRGGDTTTHSAVLDQALLPASAAAFFDSAQLLQTVAHFLTYLMSEAPADVLTVIGMCLVLAACEQDEHLAALYQPCVERAANLPGFERCEKTHACV